MGHELKSSHQLPERDAICVARLDRIRFGVERSGRRFGRRPPSIPSFVTRKDHFVRAQTPTTTYARMRELENPESGTKAYVQYQPTHGWLKPARITVVGKDETGIPWPDLRTISEAFQDTCVITMVELALDFTPAAGVDRAFVLAHGRFGKSKRCTADRYGGLLRYGGRKSSKLVRAYRKETVNAFRVECELHSRWFNVQKSVYLMRYLPLGEEDIQFVELDWGSLELHLRRCRPGVQKILGEARRRAGSLQELLAYLRHDAGVNNVHRFLRRMKINDEVDRALDRWCESVSPRRHRADRDREWAKEAGENGEPQS